MKRRSKLILVALMFVPGVALTAVGATLAYRGRTAIGDALVAQAKVTRVFEKTERDSNGSVSRDWVSVAFSPSGAGEKTLDAEVFSTAFLSVGDDVEVRYSARDPSQARLLAGLFGEPYAVAFLLLFGLFWLLLPAGILVLAYPRG